jgi:pimeloyl-ACP methyl ester carboxylesterase
VTIERRVPVTDEESVAAVHHPADGERWVLFCHGFGSDKGGSYERRCDDLADAGLDAVRFDFRGVGDSDGAFAASTLSSRIADLRAVAGAFGLDAFAVVGSSFGGCVAVHAAARDPRVTALVLRAPVTDLSRYDDRRREVEREGSWEHPSGHTVDERLFDDAAGYDTAAAAAEVDVPVAVVHGADDETVPPGDSFRFAAELDGEAEVRQVAGEDHRFSAAAEALFRETTRRWLDR